VAAAIGSLVFAQPSFVRADEIVKITHQRIERQAVLYAPATVAEGPAPLVIVLAGLGQTTENLRTWIHLDATADREGFRVLYPEAVDKLWSYGRPINQPMPKAGDETVDDVGFIRLLIDDLVGRKLADPARIYATGPSRGGLMAFTLACALADRIAATAPLITGMTEYQRDDCRPARVLPMMVLAGTADTTQSFGGAQGLQGRLLSVPDTMNYWRQLHGCTGRTARTLPRRNPGDRTQITLIEWNGCRGPFRLYRVDGGRHQLPSLTAESEAASTRFGLRNRDIETADEIWAFVKDVAR
jgi:polyhydroxybutyrate depolymerase